MKKTSGRTVTSPAQGFSLIELLIAMVVTLIVCGAVMSLLMQGNQAFQVQPDMTERQQNIRAAMDVIQRDIANAGAGLPPSAQVFSRNHNNKGAAAPSGILSDELEMLTNSAGLDPVLPQASQFISTSPFLLLPKFTPLDSFKSAPIPVAVVTNQAGVPFPTFALRRATYTAAPPRMTLATGGAGPNDVCSVVGNGEASAAAATGVVYQDVVRYRIDKVADDATQPTLLTPVLRRQSATNCGVWEIVARGIEDMRVTYRSAGDITGNPTAAESCTSPAICPLPLTQPADMTGAVTADAILAAATVEVQVELAARGSLYAVPGASPSKPMMTKGADNSYAFRGRLVSRGTPRAALYLQKPEVWR